MGVWENLLLGFGTALSVKNLLFCFLGVTTGTLIGVLPGLGPVATISLLLPTTFGMEPVTSIIMLCGVYYGAMYGGSTTSILVNIPGEAASVATCLDGYKMARNGRAGAALGISAFGSFIGGTLSIVGIMFLSPLLAKLALKFGPPELFSVLFLGLTMITYLCRGSILKGLVMAVAGLAVSTVGQDQVSGTNRFTFESLTLMDGFGIVPIAMGMFGIAEVFSNLEESVKQEVFAARVTGVLPTLEDWADAKWSMVRGSLIGFFVGILPGAGTVIPSFMSYTVEKKVSKHPERFGTGVIEGVAGPETANNAAAGGSMVTLLSLGLPSSIGMAILLGAFMIHGIQPGPLMMTQHPTLFWGTIASMYVGNVLLLLLNLPLVGLWVKILRIPYAVLFPLILIFCFIGSYSLNNNVYDVLVMVLFGVFGYFVRKFDYECAPFVLALVLGPMLENTFRQSLLYGDPAIFFKHPISAVLLLVSFALLASPFLPAFSRAKKNVDAALEGAE